MTKSFAAVILAAGKGSRMKSKKINKVTLRLSDKPMILHTVDLLKELSFKEIVAVVGFAKKSVIDILDGGVIFAEQKKRLGTAHAVLTALKKISEDVKHILVVNGDDSAFYTKEILEKLIKKHIESNASLTFLTINTKNPTGLGRIVRDNNEKLISIVEEKDATPKIKRINEVNPACYIFEKSFLKKFIKQIKKSPITGEYYLTSLIDLGIKHNEIIETVKAGNLVWRGVNTKEELKEAQNLFNK